jgi:hypothetical protein
MIQKIGILFITIASVMFVVLNIQSYNIFILFFFRTILWFSATAGFILTAIYHFSFHSNPGKKNKTVNNAGIVGVAVLAIGLVCRFFYWPFSGPLTTLGLLILLIVFIIDKSTDNSNPDLIDS